MPAEQSRFHLGDVGGSIILTAEEPLGTAVDISTATGLVFYFRTPKGNLVQKSATLNTTGTDGKFKYTVETGFWPITDRSLIGTWQVQGYFTLGTWTGSTTVAQFTVYDVLR